MKIHSIFLVTILILFMSGCSMMGENMTSDTISSDVSEGLEEEILPFYITAETSIYEYEEDNIFGLKAIYVKDDTVIYRFNGRIDFAAYAKTKGFRAYVIPNSEEDVTDEQFSIFSYRGDQYVILQCQNTKAVDGFWLSTYEDYDCYKLTTHQSLYLMKWKTKTFLDGKMERHTVIQEYDQEQNTWGEEVVEDISFYLDMLPD